MLRIKSFETFQNFVINFDKNNIQQFNEEKIINAKGCNCTKKIIHKIVKINRKNPEAKGEHNFSENTKTVTIFSKDLVLSILFMLKNVKWHHRKLNHFLFHCVYHPLCRITTWRLLILEITSFMRISLYSAFHLVPCPTSPVQHGKARE